MLDIARSPSARARRRAQQAIDWVREELKACPTLDDFERRLVQVLGQDRLTLPRVSELCALDKQDVDQVTRRFHIRDSKTPVGVRVVDIRPRLLDELADFRGFAHDVPMDKPAYPTTTGRRRDRNNVNARIIAPVVKRANALDAVRAEMRALLGER